MTNSFTSDAPIGVVGAGAMGAGIAEVAANAGHPVTVVDLGEEALKRGKEIVAASLASRVRRGPLTEAEAAAITGRIVWTGGLDELASARLVIEAIIERKDAKQALFAKLETVLAADAVIASNTSSLSIRDLAEGLTRPARFVGLHFFNPAPVMRLVEIISGPATDAGLLRDLQHLMSDWKKNPVIVSDVPGFIVNRVARPYYAEGFLALSEGLAPADIDRALKLGGGFRMGPLELADLIGHDINYGVAESIFAAYDGKTRFRPQPAQKALVDAGHLGRKSGRGVYPAGTSQAAPPIPAAAHSPGPLGLLIDGMPAAFGDGRSACRRAEEDGRTAILLDTLRHEEKSPVLVAALSPLAPADAAARVAVFAKRVGREALILPDRPGGLILRTLAQLANAAADALHDKIASAEDIDDAMMHGANHPEGPLAWTRRIGPDFVRQALDHIARETGDDLYAPSPELTP